MRTPLYTMEPLYYNYLNPHLLLGFLICSSSCDLVGLPSLRSCDTTLWSCDSAGMSDLSKEADSLLLSKSEIMDRFPSYTRKYGYIKWAGCGRPFLYKKTSDICMNIRSIFYIPWVFEVSESNTFDNWYPQVEFPIDIRTVSSDLSHSDYPTTKFLCFPFKKYCFT